MILIWTIFQPFYTVVLTSKSVWNTNSVQYWLLWTTQQQQGRLLPYLFFILVWFLEFFCYCHFNTSRRWKQFEAKWIGKNHLLLILYLKCCLISFCNQLVLQLSPSRGKSLSPPPPPPYIVNQCHILNASWWCPKQHWQWVMMPPYKSEIDHYTGHDAPYSLRRVCGFFNIPQIFYYMCKGLWDGAYGLSSLSKKTRLSNRLQMLLQRQHFLLIYLKTLSVGPAGVWTYSLPLSRLALISLS